MRRKKELYIDQAFLDYLNNMEYALNEEDIPEEENESVWIIKMKSYTKKHCFYEDILGAFKSFGEAKSFLRKLKQDITDDTDKCYLSSDFLTIRSRDSKEVVAVYSIERIEYLK